MSTYQGNLGGTFRKPDTVDGVGSDTRLLTSGPFLGYLAEEIYERSLFVQSGVVTNLAVLGGIGKIRTEVPFWGPINPYEEVIQSNSSWGNDAAGSPTSLGAFTSQKVEDATQYASIIHRGFQYAADDLTVIGIGSDPLAHLRSQLSQALSKLFTKRLTSQLTGLFDDALSANSVSKASGAPTATEANYLNVANVTEARYLLGERGQSLNTLVIHPTVAAYLEQVGQLQFSTAALVDNGAIAWGSGGIGVGPGRNQVGSAFGMNVIVDSQVPIGGTSGNQTEFDCYMMGPGAIGQADQVALQIETARNISSLQDMISIHYHHSYHILGTSWAASGDNPTDAALATSGNWSLAYIGPDGHKLIPCVRLTVNSPFGGTVA